MLAEREELPELIGFFDDDDDDEVGGATDAFAPVDTRPPRAADGSSMSPASSSVASLMSHALSSTCSSWRTLPGQS